MGHATQISGDLPELPEIVRALLTLRPEQRAEVHDFVLFLQQRHGPITDESDSWTDADIRDLVAASLSYAAGTVPGDDGADDSAG
jgi:hypothetical protein